LELVAFTLNLHEPTAKVRQRAKERLRKE
jgi:hypothetical protein